LETGALHRTGWSCRQAIRRLRHRHLEVPEKGLTALFCFLLPANAARTRTRTTERMAGKSEELQALLAPTVASLGLELLGVMPDALIQLCARVIG